MKNYLLLLLGLSLTMTRCKEACAVNAEPMLEVDLSRINHLPLYTRVYGLHGNGQNIPFKRAEVNHFPLSLVADSSVYIFEAPGRTDTLAIGYRRAEVSFQLKRCGFTTQLLSGRPLPSTTFNNIQVYFGSNRRYESAIYTVTSY